MLLHIEDMAVSAIQRLMVWWASVRVTRQCNVASAVLAVDEGSMVAHTRALTLGEDFRGA